MSPRGCRFVYGCTERIVLGGYLIRALELQQELTCEQFVRGQTDHELQKHDEDTVRP